MHEIRLILDDDDYRDVNAAIAERQRSPRWYDEEGGVLLPEGDSDLPGAIIGEICRAWLDYRRANT